MYNVGNSYPQDGEMQNLSKIFSVYHWQTLF
ncbi:hypothetical protein B23_1305 [Geobacillus thermoleovorans B23]|nr:hypothetical protein B23_1305 [Geobacillus thermoleovorans B23]